MLRLLYGQTTGEEAEETGRSVFTSEVKLLHDNKTPNIEPHMLQEQAKILLGKCKEVLPSDGWMSAHFVDRFNSIGLLHAKVYRLGAHMDTLSKTDIFPSKTFCEHIFFIEGYVINTWITD